MTPEENYLHAKVAMREERVAQLESERRRMLEFDTNVRLVEIEKLKQQCYELQRKLEAAEDDRDWWRRKAKRLEGAAS